MFAEHSILIIMLSLTHSLFRSPSLVRPLLSFALSLPVQRCCCCCYCCLVGLVVVGEGVGAVGAGGGAAVAGVVGGGLGFFGVVKA